jgi:hypothetical protein
MKRLLPALLSLCFFYACKKDATTTPTSSQDAKKLVNFSVADFIIQQENLRVGNGRVAADSSLAKISDIYYLLYKSDSTKLKFIHQDSATNKSNFGTISDSLAPGNYFVAMIASTRPIDTFHLKQSRMMWDYISARYNQNPVPYKLGDIFFKKVPVVISATENPTNLELSLNRIVGQLKVELLDALPESHPNGYIRLELNPIPLTFDIAGEAVNQFAPTGQYFTTTRVNQTTFEEYVLGSTQHPFYLYMNYKDKNTGAWISKTFENIKINVNKKTIIRGYLYGTAINPGSGDFQVKINDTYSDSTIITIK